MFVVTIFVTSDDLSACKSQLQEVASILGKDSTLYQALDEALQNAENIGDENDPIQES